MNLLTHPREAQRNQSHCSCRGDLDTPYGWTPAAFLWRFSWYVYLVGDSWADQAHWGDYMSNPHLGIPTSWKMLLWRGTSGLPCLACCLRSMTTWLDNDHESAAPFKSVVTVMVCDQVGRTFCHQCWWVDRFNSEFVRTFLFDCSICFKWCPQYYIVYIDANKDTHTQLLCFEAPH